MGLMKQLEKKAINLLSAALRHVRDADFLMQPDAASSGASFSSDQAMHLAGYGPECARKATIMLRWFDQALGHEMGENVEELLNFAIALDPIAQRYRILNWQHLYPTLTKWHPRCRYVKTGHYSRDSVQQVVEQAMKAVDRIVIALWADGCIPDGCLGRGGLL
jgi:hypothetical protein